MRYLPSLSGVANVAWLFFWHCNAFGRTLVAMLLLPASQLAIYVRLDIGRAPAAGPSERWAVHVPFSIYLGWISVARLASATDVLYLNAWDGWDTAPEAWAVILLILATLVAMLMAITRRDVAYIVVLTWAFAGIGVKQAGAPLVANAGWLAAAANVLLAARAVWRGRPVRTVPARPQAA